MLPPMRPVISRRNLVIGSASLAAAAAFPGSRVLGNVPVREFALTARSGRVRLAGPGHPETDVWTYDGKIPGPEIRLRQGERLRVRVENRLKEETTVHWHGIRLPNPMDGVPHLTQKPISPGETFTYEFVCPDAGTYWYHPHQRSHEQVGRGLSGALIVEEPVRYPVDRDAAWVVSDWRLTRDGEITDDFGDLHDLSHNGRLGNTVTVNGEVRESFAVRAGERLRLRLINAANARIFGFHFGGHRPWVIALDGQPVDPHEPEGGVVVLGPAMRVDVLLDMAGQPGERFVVTDQFNARSSYRLLDLVYGDARPLRTAPEPVLRLPDNPLSEPDLKHAERHTVILGGGMMGRMESAIVDGQRVDIRTMFRSGLIWAINGVAVRDHVHEPMLQLTRGRSYVLELVNETAWHHPMHLHGHSFRLLSVNGKPAIRREWLDTVLLRPRERAEIAFVADNPGSWMFHCHILEHQLGGMMSLLNVT